MIQQTIGGRRCQLFATPTPERILIQPAARHEEKNDGLRREATLLAEASPRGFVFAAFDCEDWALSLMPWPDEAVSRSEDVGRHAAGTLCYIEHSLLPWLRSRYGSLPCIIGGYSLGGLFALWAARQTDTFAAVAAASPSLWIKGWGGYADTHPIKTNNVYISLGDREEYCRNQRMQRIGDCVRAEYQRLKLQLGEANTQLEWNQGGHFGDEAGRTARAFVWCFTSYIFML